MLILNFQKHFILLFLLLLLLILYNCTKNKPLEDGGAPPTTVYPTICESPDWSPDGNTIAYWYSGTIKVYESGRHTIDLSLQGIWFISSDGTNRRMFLQGADLPDWSPDGQKIAFEAGTQIYTIKINGDSLKQLTFGGRNFFPDWSPDGKKIAYDRSTDEPDTSADSSAAGIWIMDADGTNKKYVVGGAFPDWSPDGTRLTYIGLGMEIYVADTSGNNQIQLTFLKDPDNRYPVFSPDGKKLAFTSIYPYLGVQIYVINSDGGNLKKLTIEGGDMPAWSPDGSKIAFVRYNATEYSYKQGQIWIMNADGSNKRQLLSMDGKFLK
jgi:TolB protein